MTEKKCPHGEGRYHDCGYVDARNKLIPQAEKIANDTPGSWKDGQQTAYWGRAFHAAMDQLAADTGLCRPPLQKKS